MNKLIKIVLTLAVGCTGSIVSLGQPQMTQGKDHKFKAKGDRVVLRDKSKPVRRALEEQYAKIAEATRKKDLVALLALRTPDFTVKTASGETWTYMQSADYVKRGFEQVLSIVSLSFTIEMINVSGNEAAAIIHQQWSRMQMMKGKLRRVDTSAVQRETWINTPEGWRLKLIDDVQPGAWLVDGKRVDPSKPYDPDAPAYDP
ncbi:MAG TPA: nuclear transport factor 2 family protein [Pyrinomonadaceae bacterium]|nr:nuclear transport factor 2 family protein [Pyrinomonadaceae bacterium]